MLDPGTAAARLSPWTGAAQVGLMADPKKVTTKPPFQGAQFTGPLSDPKGWNLTAPVKLPGGQVKSAATRRDGAS
jgi:hypothetical protein